MKLRTSGGALFERRRDDAVLQRVEQPLRRVLQRHADAVDRLEHARTSRRRRAECRARGAAARDRGARSRRAAAPRASAPRAPRSAIASCSRASRVGTAARSAMTGSGCASTSTASARFASSIPWPYFADAATTGTPSSVASAPRVDGDAEVRRLVGHVQNDHERHARRRERENKRELQLDARRIDDDDDRVQRRGCEEPLHERLVVGMAVERVDAGQVGEPDQRAAEQHSRRHHVDRHAGPVRHAGAGARQPVEERRLSGVGRAERGDTATRRANGRAVTPRGHAM